MLLITTLTLAAPPPPTLDAALLDQLVAQADATYDATANAYVRNGSVRFDALELALRLARRDRPDAQRWQERALATVAWSHALYDSVGGGFTHSTRDLDPMTHVFDKWTADNAALLEGHLDAWWLTSSEDNLRWARRIADYSDRVLIDPRAGFLKGQVGDHTLFPMPNAQGARAYLYHFRATGERRRREFALRALDSLWARTWNEQLGFVRPVEVGHPTYGQLEDAVAMGFALLEAHAVAGREQDLERARTLGQFIFHRHEDAEKGGFFNTAVIPEKGGFRVLRRSRDSDLNAQAARFLVALSRATGDDAYEQAARRAMVVFVGKAAEKGDEAASWALAVDELLAPPPLRPQPVADKDVPAAKPQPRSKRYR